MEIQKLLDIMTTAEKLKDTLRHSWTTGNRQESVAEHSWRVALMAYFVKDEFPTADIHKVILMCLFHDLGEAITGDVPTFIKNAQHRQQEDDEVYILLSQLPSPFKEELLALFAEMNAQETLEAHIYKALDKMEALIQHNEADIATWLPLEYELNFTYGTKEVAFSPYMQALKEEINRNTTTKIGLAKAENRDALS